MLLQTRRLLEERGRMTLREMAQHFDMEPGAMEPILEQLMTKGQVRLVSGTCSTPCKGCPSNCREDMLIYEADKQP